MQSHFVREAPGYLDVMNASDVVTVSTPEMAEHTRLLCPRPVYVRRNFADRQTLDVGKMAMSQVPRNNDRFRVCFASGSHGHEIDFAEIQDDVIAFLQAAPNRDLVILGHFDKQRLPEALRDRVKMHSFTDYQAYLRVLASTDVAIMPLADDQFNRCKSAVRVLDAFAVAVPSIVGHVSDMKNVVSDGQSGRVVGKGQSWLDALEDVANQDAFAMGQEGRRQLETRWSARLEQPIVDQGLVDWVMK